MDLFAILLYVVGSGLTIGSPIRNSTPGGIEMGSRPSFDGRAADAEKDLAPGDWNAGMRKDGNNVIEQGSMAFARALVLPGASMVAGCSDDDFTHYSKLFKIFRRKLFELS